MARARSAAPILVLCVAAASAAAPTAHAGPLALDITDPGSIGGFLPPGNNTYGWGFRLARPFAVDGLGFFDLLSEGFVEEHRVGIWRVSDGSLRVSATIQAGAASALVASVHSAGDWRFESADLTLLHPGTYVIGGLAETPRNAGVPFDPFIFQNGPVVTTPGLTYLGARFSTTGSGFTLPTNPFDVTRGGFFGPTFSGTVVPEPGTLGMLALGLCGLAIARRRRRRVRPR